MRKMPNDVEKLDQISQVINSDGQGNLTVNKDLEVDGKLKLKSLVSASNPDGDITKELGGGSSGDSGSARHCYAVEVDGQFIYIVNTAKNYNFTIGKEKTINNFTGNPIYAELHAGGESFGDYRYYPAIGTYKGSDGALRVVRYLRLYDNYSGYVNGISLNSSTTTGSASIDLSKVSTPFSVVQLY